MFDMFHLNEDISRQLHETQQEHIDIPFSWIMEYDSDYADLVMENPQEEVKTLSTVASNFAKRQVTVQIHKLPSSIHIHQVQRGRLYSLVQVTGTVMQRTEKKSRPTMLVYKCPVCGEEIDIEQTEQWRLAPEKCNCDNRKVFTKLYERTTFDDCQWLEIQELLDSRGNTDTPAKIKVLVRNHLIDACTPGETVTVVGVPKVLEDKPNTSKLEMEVYLDCVGMNNQTEIENIKLTEEDKEKLRQYASDPEHLKKVIQSYAPTVYGEELVKEALAYQQCEGNTRMISKKKRRRGQVHILLAGPPGVAKSDLGEYQMLYHPKGRMATGRGASNVGLTASVVQENGEWVLKAGAMALADNGLLFIDEIEKMRGEDSGAMHPGMEGQQIPISKAGINATVKTRCSIVAACNPIGGKWIDDRGLTGNLIEKGHGLTLPLLNRFALIFVVKEKDEEEDESMVVDHILKLSESPDDLDTPYDEDMMRKLFIYARTFTPKLSKDASAKLKEFYLTLFKASKAQEGMIMSRRQIEDLVRLAEASAKLHLREEATIEDARNAVRIMAASLKQYGIDPLTGKYDVNAVYYSYPKSKNDRRRMLPAMLKHACSKNIDTSMMSRVEFVRYLVSVWNIPESEVGELINDEIQGGTIYCPSPKFLAVSE